MANEIKVNELRIGNWVTDGKFKYEIDISSLTEIAAGDDDAYPIPLTGEVLTGLGFDFRNDDNQIWQHKASRLCLFKSEDKFSYVCVGVHPHSQRVTKVGSVHQLQNLYHSLTGQELEITI